MTLTDQDIEFVTQLSMEAGRMARDMRSDITIREKTGPTDMVTSADIALSGMIKDALSRRFPDDQVISEEDLTHYPDSQAARIWMVDPIDGTQSYIRTEKQYSVMIGLLEAMEPTFGFVFGPAEEVCYYGGPGFGAWKIEGDKRSRIGMSSELKPEGQRRLLMGSRDRRKNPWIEDIPDVEFVRSGSVGLKVARILENDADIFIHLSGKLKAWDTAGPTAIALGGGLVAGTLEEDTLPFETRTVKQKTSVIIGRRGCLEWCRDHLKQPL